MTPPIVLFLSFESLMGMVKSGVRRQEYAEKLADLAKQRDTLEANVVDLSRQIERLTATREDIKADIKLVKQTNVETLQKAKQTKIDKRRSQVGQLIEAGRTEQDIAKKLAVSVKTIQRDKVAITNGRNGSHK